MKVYSSIYTNISDHDRNTEINKFTSKRDVDDDPNFGDKPEIQVEFLSLRKKDSKIDRGVDNLQTYVNRLRLDWVNF